MADNNNGSNGALGVILGGIAVVAATFFILTGGELSGNKKVGGDADMPPVAMHGTPGD